MEREIQMEQLLGQWNLAGRRVKQIYRTAWEVGDSHIVKAYQDREQMIRSNAVQEALYSLALPVAKIIPICGGEKFAAHEGIYFVCQEKLPSSPGTDIRDAAVARQMGRAIGQLHAGLEKCGREIPFWDNSLLGELKGWIGRRLQEDEWSLVSRQEYEENVAELEQFWPKLPGGVIHRDVHLGNFLFKDGKFTGYVDFDLVQKNIRLFDLCYFLSGLLVKRGDSENALSEANSSDASSPDGNLPLSKQEWFGIMEEVIGGYEEVSLLSALEKKAAFCVMEGIELLMTAYYIGIGQRGDAKEAKRIYDSIREWKLER